MGGDQFSLAGEDVNFVKGTLLFLPIVFNLEIDI
jgi:hypothetical protein